MNQSESATNRKIIIVSASPLFAAGLEKILRQQKKNRQAEIKHVSNLATAKEVLETWQPEVAIVDYDDKKIERGEFLNYFVQNQSPMQVMLVSLQENGSVVVYDRRVLTSDQAEDWLSFS